MVSRYLAAYELALMAHEHLTASGNVAHDALVETLSRTGWSDVPAGDARPLPVSVPMSAPPSRRHVQRERGQVPAGGDGRAEALGNCRGVPHAAAQHGGHGRGA